MTKTDLTADQLREVLHYNPDTGVFLRYVNSRRRKNMLVPAGGKSFFGHIAIYVLKKAYQSHRLAWLYVHGTWPNQDIDHINGIPFDNRISNLRQATKSVNAQNRRTSSAGEDRLLGVAMLKRDIPKRFTAAITRNGKKHFLGYFYTPEEAHQAYVRAKRIFHEGCTI